MPAVKSKRSGQLFVAVAYLLTYGVLFVAKFFAYQHFVFQRPTATDAF